MNPETEGKALVALVISLIAFGFGSGAEMVAGIGLNNNSTPIVNNSTQEMPQIPSSNNVSISQESQSNTNTTNNDVTYTEPSTSDDGDNNKQPSNPGNSTKNDSTGKI